MKFAVLALPALGAAFAIPQITGAPVPVLHKRGGTTESILKDKIWTSTSGGVTERITPTYWDGVTISASPVSSSQMTPWVSLDGSGIPYMYTPTASDGTTVSSSPVPEATDYPEPDSVPPVLRCFGSAVPSSDSQSYPFCTGVNGTEMIVGETYWLTWDPTHFQDAATKVTISLVAYPQTGSDSDDALFTSDQMSNANGYYPLNIQSHYIRSGNGYFSVVITPIVTSQSTSTNVSPISGPVVRAIISDAEASSEITRVPSDNNDIDTASSSSSKKNNAKVIAPAVVVPVIAVICIAAFVVYYLNKQKKNNASGSSGPSATAGDSHGNGDIHLSRTTTKDNASIITEETGHNPFQETSRTVL